MTNPIFRVHPTINFARVGDSQSYYIAPETAAGELIDTETGLFGGLPIKAGTESTAIEESDFRDSDHKLVRQAARFRIYAYEGEQTGYPSGDAGVEIKIGSQIGGKTVKDIIWSVHLANKKNNWYEISAKNGMDGIFQFEPGNEDQRVIRDPSFGDNLSDEKRLRQLIIDAGPHTLSSLTEADTIREFDGDPSNSCSFINEKGEIQQITNYPKSFPNQFFDMTADIGPEGNQGQIESLGQMRLEAKTGRLIVTGGYGKASGIKTGGKAPEMDDAIDNNYWFDDTSDGPVNATVVFDDNSTADVVAGWVVTTDPGYAPQTRNVVSVWDDIFDSWVRNLDLIPSLYSQGLFNPNFEAPFYDEILPVFHGAFLQRWNTALPMAAIKGHEYMANIQPTDDPSAKIPNFKSLLRAPNSVSEAEDGSKMPLSLGDAGMSLLSLSETQYFMMMQWYAKKSTPSGPTLGAGEKLDKAVLLNCLGGRYSPGIDLTFIVRDINLYQQNWRGVTGPFRINQAPLDYSNISQDKAFLGVGYIPLQKEKVEPGDLCKFMSQPWHSDYNSCAVHQPDPVPANSNTLYWSWPAQRPVQVYPKFLCKFNTQTNSWDLNGQLFSVRGEGTFTDLPQDEGRFQSYPDFVENWTKVGFVIQGLQVPSDQGDHYGADKFIEVQSRLPEESDKVQPWPTSAVTEKQQ